MKACQVYLNTSLRFMYERNQRLLPISRYPSSLLEDSDLLTLYQFQGKEKNHEGVSTTPSAAMSIDIPHLYHRSSLCGWQKTVRLGHRRGGCLLAGDFEGVATRARVRMDTLSLRNP